MANKRITELADIGTPAGSDVLEIVDVSDTTDSPEGTSKRVLVSALSGGGGAVDSVNGQTGVVSIDLESVLTEGNRPIKSVDNNSAYDFVAEDKGKFLIATGTEPLTLNADIFDEGDTLLIIAEAIDIQIVQGAGVTLKGNGGNASDFTLRLGEMAVLTNDNLNAWWVNIIPQITSQTIPQTTSFTAEVDLRYTANGTLTVTDPTPIANKGFIVHVIGGSVTIGGVAYTSGALVYRYYDGASWISTNMNNAITIDATPTDGSSNAVSSNGVFDALALKANLASPALTGTPTAPTQSANDNSTKIATTAYADAKVADSITDGVTTIAPSQNAVFDALAIRQRYLVKDTVVSSAVTGTLTETLVKSYTIPANTLGANDYFRINCITSIKTGVADISSIRVRISNTNNFVGSLLISSTSHSNTTIFMKHMRDFAYRGGVLKGYNNTTTIFQDKERTATPYTSTTIDFTQPVYVFVSIQNSNLVDSTVIEDVLISN